MLPPGKRAGRLKIKGRKFQYQSVDSDVEHGIFFIFMFYLGRVNLSEGKKSLVLPSKVVDICEESTY